MAFTDEDKEKMDQAAKEAGEELAKLEANALVGVANWWKKWYMKAGHKRLARILLQYAKEK